MFNNIYKIQETIKNFQKELQKIEVTGISGAGLVQITMNGEYICKNIQIDPSLLIENKKIIEELITAAFNDATKKISSKKKNKILSISQLLNLPPDII